MPRGSVLPRPRRVDVVVGKPVVPPAPGGAARDGVTESEGSRGRTVRVSRRALHDFSGEVGAAIQAVFDQAEARLRK